MAKIQFVEQNLVLGSIEDQVTTDVSVSVQVFQGEALTDSAAEVLTTVDEGNNAGIGKVCFPIIHQKHQKQNYDKISSLHYDILFSDRQFCHYEKNEDLESDRW